MSDRPCVFIHTNARQYIGAVVSRHSMRRHSAHPDRFDVRILHSDDFAFLRAREGQVYRREGRPAVWRMDDLQSFTPLRFAPPELMGHRGRAIVVDPDVFAVGDVLDLFAHEMGGKAILCRARSGTKGRGGGMASSVMLLDCAKLAHWDVARDFAALFDAERDYMDWICLKLEPAGSIGLFEPEWNDFDRLSPQTRLLHNTKRETQPWKSGLPVDFTPARKPFRALSPASWLRSVLRLGGGGAPRVYRPHPDPAQERFFFGLLRECLEQGEVTERQLRDEMQRAHLRRDALDVLERTPSLAA